MLKYQQLLKQVEHLKNVNQELRTQQQQATTHAKNVSSYQRCPNLSKDIARKVKYEIFREIKFITSQEELDDLDQPNSIGNKVLEMFPIAPEDKWMFWNTYNIRVETHTSCYKSLTTHPLFSLSGVQHIPALT